jgi:hypothetical protein
MIPRLGLATLPDIEAALLDLAQAIDKPQTPDLASAVGARLRSMPAYLGPMALPTPVTVPPRRLPVIRSVRRSLLLAAAISLLIVGAVLGVRFGLDLLEIEFGPVPSASASPSARASAGAEPVASPGRTVGPSASVDAGSRLGLGLRSTLEAVTGDVDFTLLVPAALGPPDEVYEGGSSLRGQIAFGYRPRPDLPENGLLAGLGLLITQNHGRIDEGLVRKLLDMASGTVERVDIDGAPAIWIAGGQHVFWYLAPDGAVIHESERRVGDTLAWERDGVLYRIEGAASKERALEIARSMQAP